MTSNTQKYIVMTATVEGSTFVGPFQRSSFQSGGVTALLRNAFPAGANIPVTSSAVDDVAMLELTDDQARSFEVANGAIKLHPVRTYRLAAIEIDRALMAAGPYSFGIVPQVTNTPFRIRVEGPRGQPVANAGVVVCEWGTNNVLEGKTDATGHATIPTGLLISGGSPNPGSWRSTGLSSSRLMRLIQRMSIASSSITRRISRCRAGRRRVVGSRWP